MRFPGLSKEKKAKNGTKAAVVESSDVDPPAASEEHVRTCVCANCGKSFTEPVQLTVRGKGSGGEYSACPHCFSRISSSDTEEKGDSVEESVDQALPEDDSVDSEEAEETEEIVETGTADESPKPSSCGHFVGYLKTLPKGAQTPEECFTCPSLIKCKF